MGTLPLVVLPQVAGAQAFVDITASSGAQHEHVATDLPMPIGAGAGFIDVDNDGDDDLFLIQGTGCNRLLLNDGTGAFTELTDAGGAAACSAKSQSISAADYDNDGDQDLHIGVFGQNMFFKNMLIENGSLSFVDSTAAVGLDSDGERNTASTTWGDFNNDGYLDLYAGNHVGGPGTVPPDPPEPGPPPGCFGDYLWMNNGDGTFTDIAPATGIELSGVLAKAGCQLASTWSDYDNDGDADLMVVNDFGLVRSVPNRLFRNDGSDGNGGWIFTDVSASSGFDYSQAGMGIAVGDLNRDGHFDYYMSDAGANELAVNNGDGTFTESAGALGVQVDDVEDYGGLGLVSWGNGFFDLDGDAWEDLVVCNGGAPQDIYPGFFEGENYQQLNPCYLFRNQTNTLGVFGELHTQLGVAHSRYYRGVAASDIDNDGDMDLHLNNLHGMHSLYRNNMINSNQNGWMKVNVRGTLGNRDGIGTRINLTSGGVTLIREVDGGSSFMSTHTNQVHYGLKAVPAADIVATFPSGVTQELLFVTPNQTLDIVEPQVTADLQPKFRAIVEGAQATSTILITNHTDVEQTRDVWLAQVSLSGEVPGVARSITLAPGQTKTVQTILTGAAPAGVTKWGARLGDFDAGTVSHRNHSTLVGLSLSISE